jgi:tetratricopeptide (TPR) repeat protein
VANHGEASHGRADAPGLPASERTDSRQGLDKGVAAWRELAARANTATNWPTAAWLFLKVGDTLASQRRGAEAHAAYQAAIELAQGHDEPTWMASMWDTQGLALERQNDFPKAEAAYREALRIRERGSPDTLAVATSFNHLGALAFARSDLKAAEDWFTRSLAIREKSAPDSLVVAAALSNLGALARNRGDPSAAEKFHGRALAIREKRAPESVLVARSWNNIGVVAADRGDLHAAEEAYKRALGIYQKVAPDSVDVARSLNNLGIVGLERRDLVAAEEFFRRSLALHEIHGPEGVNVAGTLANIGLVARERGDLDAAENAHRRSLAIAEKIAPDSLEVAASLNNLGTVAFERRDLSAAENAYKRALAIHERLAPDSVFVAASLSSLASVTGERDAAAADVLLRRSLAILEKVSPDSLAVASVLENLGELARDRGDLTTSQQRYEQTLAIRQRLAPGSTGEAAALHALGLLARRAGRDEVAVNYLQQAVAALETQTGRLGGAEDVRSGFTARYADYYRAYVDVLQVMNRPAEAFQVLERSRARSLLAMLAERDILIADDLPEDLARTRTLLNADYDRTQAAISQLNPGKETGEIDRLLVRLRELRDKREGIVQTIRKTSPRFASLHYPEPLDVAGAQHAMDAGTVLLAYCVTKEKTFLFVLQGGERPPVPRAPPVLVFTLQIGETPLREKVAAFRRLIQREVESDAGSAAALVSAGQELFDTLIKPAQALIAASDRVLISPDGPLHTLPFAALVQSSDRSAPALPRYFIEWKPLHVVVSATVYGEVKKRRRRPGDPPPSMLLAAFGDPTYPALPREQPDKISNLEVHAAIRRGYALEPLPASRREVEGSQASIQDVPPRTWELRPRRSGPRPLARASDISILPAMACSTSGSRSTRRWPDDSREAGGGPGQWLAASLGNLRADASGRRSRHALGL